MVAANLGGRGKPLLIELVLIVKLKVWRRACEHTQGMHMMKVRTRTLVSVAENHPKQQQARYCLSTSFQLLERELKILSVFDFRLFWLQPDTINTDMCTGGKCFGTKSTDNEREHEVAVLVCPRCSLKSIVLSGVYAHVYSFFVLRFLKNITYTIL